MKASTGFVLLIVTLLTGAFFYGLTRYIENSNKSIYIPSRKVEILPTGTNKGGETVSLSINPRFRIRLFASNLGNARDLTFTDSGTLLVSTPASGEVVALPDRNNDGVADEARVIIRGKNKPHGLAFRSGKLFVAEVNRVARYTWNEQTLQATEEKELFSLPGGGNHFARSLVFDKQGKLYVSIGSTCNVCFEKHSWIAGVIVSDAEGRSPRLFAKGLRNAPFLALNPQSGAVWVTEMGRDYLGDNLPPDEINMLQDGKDYGWPLCYGKKQHDAEFDKNVYTDDPCLFTEAPIFEIPAHSAPLGLAFIASSQFPKDWQNDLLVAYHGSWNRSEPTGYKIVHMVVRGNTILTAEDFLTGFLQDGKKIGRPVDVVFDRQGNLFVSDDEAGMVYIIQQG
ncbi:MAG: sorbosone dehydrogenase family protein [Candidatus Levybacteria bacterium]|nr:sorbosone dehydrogenase family protein [Candidatus Levybacteria bacterium]